MSSEIVTRVARTWNGAPADMKNVPVADFESLQRRFRGRLEIIRLNDGGVRIYPDNSGDQTEFDAFMATQTNFTPQMMRVT
tara:strand:- start:431 stop:673 length:243 start_codon:yes stop_codon:yes gene_type:complete